MKIKRSYSSHRLIPLLAVLLTLGLLARPVSSLRAEVDPVGYQEAYQLWQQGKYEASLEKIRELIKGNIGHYHLHFLAAHNYWRQRNLKSAQAHFRRAMKAEPEEKGVYVDFARMYLDFDRTTSARRIAVRGLRKVGENEELRSLIARSYYMEKKYRASLKHVYLAKQQNSEYPEAVFLEALNNLALGNYQNAEFLLGWAHSLAPANPEIIFHFARAQAYLGDLAHREGDAAQSGKRYRQALSTLEKGAGRWTGNLEEEADRLRREIDAKLD